MPKKMGNCNGDICVSQSSILGKFEGNSNAKLDYVKDIFNNRHIKLYTKWFVSMAPIYIADGVEKFRWHISPK